MAAPLLAVVPAVVEVIKEVIDKVVPDKNQSEAMKIRMVELVQQGELASLANLTENLKIETEDRASARMREIQTSDSITTRMLASVFVAGFFGVLFWMLAWGVPEKGGDALMVLLGALSAGVAAILAYYFGSSSGSWLKNFMIK